MTASRGDIEFIDNPSAPEFFASGLQELQPMGASITRLVWYAMRQSPQGIPYREQCGSCIIPNDVIVQIIMLLANKTDLTEVLSAVGQTGKLLM